LPNGAGNPVTELWLQFHGVQSLDSREMDLTLTMTMESGELKAQTEV
jgi:hypothetical protein